MNYFEFFGLYQSTQIEDYQCILPGTEELPYIHKAVRPIIAFNSPQTRGNNLFSKNSNSYNKYQ